MKPAITNLNMHMQNRIQKLKRNIFKEFLNSKNETHYKKQQQKNIQIQK